MGNYKGEAITWQVMEVENGEATLLSEHILNYEKYNTKDEPVTWETCTLRGWLNGEFYNTAFSKEEKEKIKITILTNEDNPVFGRNGLLEEEGGIEEDYPEGGSITKDRVYLLSLSDMEKFFQVTPSNYVAWKSGEITLDEYSDPRLKCDGINTWWLRSPGRSSHVIAVVDTMGGDHVDFSGHEATVDVNPRNMGSSKIFVYYTYGGVRPVIKISL